MCNLISKRMNIILQICCISCCCLKLGHAMPVKAEYAPRGTVKFKLRGVNHNVSALNLLQILHKYSTTGVTAIIDDIKITDVDPYSKIKDLWLRSAVADKSRVWTNGIIPYYIDDTFFAKDEVDIIKAAMNEFHSKTCVRFVPRTTEMPYLFVTPLSRCWSEIGMPLTEGINTLSLGEACLQQRGTVIHELMHVLGFWHEQNRFDRDNYIDVNWDNIVNGMQHNFFKYSEEKVDTLQEPYDYQSIMHYSAFAFAKDPQKQTIVPKIPTMIGQRFGLSVLDIRKIEKLYGCSSKPRPLASVVHVNQSIMPISIKPGQVNNTGTGSEIVFPSIVTELVPLPFKFDWQKTTPCNNPRIVFPVLK